MKRITLHRITLQNFKGAENETHDFNGQDAVVSGKNGSGKTTIFDAFTWLLFGKDHLGRSKFDIKPLDSHGKEVGHLDVEVTATIQVDDEEITLKRIYKETWTKKRGTTDVVLTGHTEDYYINEAPLKAKEYKEEVNNICTEEVFRAITNPQFFPEQKPEEQRKILAQLVSIAPEDIRTELEMEHSPEEVDTICQTCGTISPDKHRATLAAKKKECQQLITTIPARIEEIQKTYDPREKPDFAVAFAIDNANKQLAELQQGISTNETTKHRAQLSMDISQRMAEITQQTKRAYEEDTFNAAQQAARLDQERETLQYEVNHRPIVEDDLRVYEEKREALIQEWRSIKAETFEIDPNDLRCPCCQRPLEPSQVENKVAEMEANFNAQKAQKLAENQRKGQEVKAKREAAEAQLQRIEAAAAKLEEVKLSISSLKSQEKARQTLEQHIEAALKNDKQLNALHLELESIPEATPSQEDEQRQQKIEELQNKIAELNVAKTKEAAINEAEKRIKELRAQLKEANQKLADVEREEDLRTEYSKAVGKAMEAKLNNRFKFVKFQLFEYTIDGTPKETCKATVDGVAYSSTLNTADKYNAGLDIIQTLCQHYQVQAPVFIDNAESVNHILDIPSQTIELRATLEDFNITLINNNQ